MYRTCLVLDRPDSESLRNLCAPDVDHLSTSDPTTEGPFLLGYRQDGTLVVGSLFSGCILSSPPTTRSESLSAELSFTGVVVGLTLRDLYPPTGAATVVCLVRSRLPSAEVPWKRRRVMWRRVVSTPALPQKVGWPAPSSDKTDGVEGKGRSPLYPTWSVWV